MCEDDLPKPLSPLALYLSSSLSSLDESLFINFEKTFISELPDPPVPSTISLFSRKFWCYSFKIISEKSKGL
jgi:hypothetical protein